MNDVTRQDVAELSCHIDREAFIFPRNYLLCPCFERLHQLDLKGIQHVLKSVFVESVCAGLPLSLPNFIVPGENERVA